jgi:hypothetical protein
MDKKLHLVGSIPFDTAEDVFEKFGAALGPHLNTMPDGEVGLRSHWISRVHYQVLALHPDIEVLRQPALEDGAERLNPRNAGDSWLFKLRAGAGAVHFGDAGWRLGFARDAVNSYFIFRTLRSAGRLASHLRFQVSMPTVNSAVPGRVFEDAGDADKVKPGYEAALAGELATIVSKIPAQDLAIQWDCTSELQDAYGRLAEYPADGLIERNMKHLRRLCPLIPGGAELGYHLCYGTLGGWPRWEPDDLGGAVRMANAFAEHSGRKVDWIHIPVLDRSDDAYFAPLADLNTGGARIYLGAVHNMERFSERIATASKYLADFGVGAYCGFGRIPPEELSGVLDDHLRALEM